MSQEYREARSEIYGVGNGIWRCYVKMAKQEKIEEEEEKTYKNPVLFLRKSKAGKHLYAFNHDGALGGDVGSIIMDVSEVERLLEGSTEWIKVGVIPEDTAGDTEEA
jgi:hypothetical protein